MSPVYIGPMPIIFSLVLTIALASLSACGGDGDGESQYSRDCQGLKDFLSDCRVEFPNLEFETDAETQETCDLLVISSTCFAAQYTAGCEEHAGEDTSTTVTDACAPTCTEGEPNACNGDINTICADVDDSGTFREYQFNCGPLCALDGGSYVGECSSMYMDQTSDTGDVCWC